MAREQNTKDYSCTRVTPNMVVTGNIESTDNVLVEGQVFGNINTSADVTSSNLVVGDIRANSMGLNGAKIKGSLSLDGTLVIGQNTIVVGDIMADAIKVAGKVKGNINVKESALLGETALIVGDITAGDVSTQSGARINGTITTNQTKSIIDVDSEFDLGNLVAPEINGGAK